MKKLSIVAASVLLAASSAPLHADWFFGLYGEAQYWKPETSGAFGTTPALNTPESFHDFDDDNQLRLALALHHPVPLLPNIRIERQELEMQSANLETGGQYNLDFSHDTLTLYYAPLDNELTRIHFGISAKRFDGQVTSGSSSFEVDDTIPMGYLMGGVGLPFTGLSAYARAHVFAFDDNKVNDIEAALQYQLIDSALIDANIQLGYRIMHVELDDVGGLYSDLDFKGPFAGVQLHF